MIRRHLRTALLLLACPSVARAITAGQVDTFENGTTMAWEEGLVSPNPPVNIATGGPAGAGDHFLRNASSGDIGLPGGKMTMFNVVQWSGDYVAAGVTHLALNLVNLGVTTLYIRIGVQGTIGQYASTTAFPLPPDGQWHGAMFGLGATDLTSVGAAEPLAVVLTSVTMLRVLSAQTAPSFHGDEVAALLGVDNLRALTPSAVGEGGAPAARPLTGAPNPFAAGTRLHFALPLPGPVSVDIFDVTGRRVRKLTEATELAAGPHALPWDGRDSNGVRVAPGVYFARLRTPSLTMTARLQVSRG